MSNAVKFDYDTAIFVWLLVYIITTTVLILIHVKAPDYFHLLPQCRAQFYREMYSKKCCLAIFLALIFAENCYCIHNMVFWLLTWAECFRDEQICAVLSNWAPSHSLIWMHKQKGCIMSTIGRVWLKCPWL